MDIDRTSRRILGALIEKRLTTPDLYPLTLNALVAACNQKSNRDPVMELEEFLITGCLMTLRQEGMVVVHERDTGRVLRYGERLSERLGFSRHEEAVVAELLLRGPQTSPELYRRCMRMTQFDSPEQVDKLLGELAAKKLVRLLPRQTGQRHARWTHLFAPASEAPEPTTVQPVEEEPTTSSIPILSTPYVAAGPITTAENQLEELRSEVARLRAEMNVVRSALERLAAPQELKSISFSTSAHPRTPEGETAAEQGESPFPPPAVGPGG